VLDRGYAIFENPPSTHSGTSLDLRLAEETSAEAEHAVLELATLLDA
jgi:hypothetical protein